MPLNHDQQSDGSYAFKHSSVTTFAPSMHSLQTNIIPRLNTALTG
jgi:hypothetical protein